MHHSRLLILISGCTLLSMGCQRNLPPEAANAALPTVTKPHPAPTPLSPRDRVIADCRRQTLITTGYDASYRSLHYPGGDVDSHTGVCADVVVRGFRAAGIDLQKEVHEDMQSHFAVYPRLWQLRRPDPNIDHRRVANLMTYFKRQGCTVPASQKQTDFVPGDVVAWRIPSSGLHIGIVADAIDPIEKTPLLVHNVGAGARLENVLFAWPIVGHYRYFKNVSK